MTKTFEFIDFEPNTSVADKAMEKISRIFSESPSDSNTKAFLKKTARGFEGRLQVSSAVGTFMAEFIGEDPSKVIDRLSRKVRSQLRVWKRQRVVTA